MTARRFVIITTQRTGSTLLVKSLDSSPQVFCAGELFHHGPNVHHVEFRYPPSHPGRRALALVGDLLFQKSRITRHLDRFYEQAGATARAVGFKLMVSQLRRYPAVMSYLLSRAEITRFYLCRQDTFATAMSYFKARASGVFHSNRVTRRDSPLVITARHDDFERALRRCESENRRLRELHSAYGGRLIAYEDMTTNWDEFIEAMGSELDLAGLRVDAALSRLGESQASIQVENEDELRRRYSGGVVS